MIQNNLHQIKKLNNLFPLYIQEFSMNMLFYDVCTSNQYENGFFNIPIIPSFKKLVNLNDTFQFSNNNGYLLLEKKTISDVRV